MSSKTYPSLSFEQSLQTKYVIGIDEVGRGCIAGDVAVGAVLIQLDNKNPWPEKLRDSKMLSEKVREQIFPEVISWVDAHAVGLASVSEIEQQGIVAALRLAANRAIQALLPAGFPVNQAVIILDGNQDYLNQNSIRVVTKVKADQDCVSVAAASVIAKVTRDSMMLELAKSYPGYGLEGNKGYGSAEHRSALQKLGPTPIHRISWLSKILEG